MAYLLKKKYQRANLPQVKKFCNTLMQRFSIYFDARAATERKIIFALLAPFDVLFFCIIIADMNSCKNTQNKKLNKEFKE